jgi:hypothetical protein
MKLKDKVTYKDISLSKNYLGSYVGVVVELNTFSYCRVDWLQPNVVKNVAEYIPNLELIKD